MMLGEFLQRAGLVSPAQIEVALSNQKQELAHQLEEEIVGIG